MFLKPADGLKVMDPARRDYLPEAGRAVTLDNYWRRRLADGDVIEATPAEKAGKKT